MIIIIVLFVPEAQAGAMALVGFVGFCLLAIETLLTRKDQKTIKKKPHSTCGDGNLVLTDESDNFFHRATCFDLL